MALAALGATVAEPRRARRLLDLTGIGVDDLRARASDPALLVAVIQFLELHEPDMMAVAQEIGVGPAELADARRKIEEGTDDKWRK